MKQRIRRRLERRFNGPTRRRSTSQRRGPGSQTPPGALHDAGNWAAGRTFQSMGHYRFYELDPFDHITAGYSVECGSDAAAMRAARTLLERSTGVEVWKSNHCMAHLSAEARQLGGQLREDWMASS